MSAAVPVYRDNETFFAPFFEVRMGPRTAGESELQALPEDIVRDVMQVTCKDKIDEMESFELTVNNWDAAERKFKFEPPSLSRYEKVFDPGKKIRITMGYQHTRRNARLMLEGEITTVEPQYQESGGSRLSVRGLSALHSLKKKQHTWSWQNKRDSQIAQEIGRQPVSENRPGLGVEVRVNDGAMNAEQPEPFVFMNNEYDILFLLQRARRHGYSVHFDNDPVTGARFLYFGPSDRLRDITYELEWGKSLIEFKPTLTSVNQVSQVTVRGWNRQTQRPIEGTARWGDRGLEVNGDQHSIALAVAGREEIVTDRPISSEAQARSIARDILLNQLREMVKATGSTVGLPDLRAGRKVHIRGFGARIDGVFFVNDSSHSIGDSGYRVTFGAKRETPLGGAR